MLTYNPKIPKCKINDNHIKQIVKAPNQLRLGAFIVTRKDKLRLILDTPKRPTSL